MPALRIYRTVITVLAAIAITACGGGGGSSDTQSTPMYYLSGTIIGLLGNSGLVLTTNNMTASIAGNKGSFQFGALAAGTNYNIVVQESPPGMVCWIKGGSGTLTAHTDNILVTCGNTLGGTIDLYQTPSGIGVTGLVITNEVNGDSYTFTSDATSFTMPQPLSYAVNYALTVTTQPPGLDCSVINGSGPMPPNHDVVVSVLCQPWFSSPAGVALDLNGDIYVADTLHSAIKKITVSTGKVTTLGSGFNQPYGVAVDASGNVYVADTYNQAVKEIAAGSGTITTLASGFNFLCGIAVDTSGNVYVTDNINNEVAEIVAGSGSIIKLSSGFNNPCGIAVDSSDNLYVADSKNNAVKKIAAGTHVITTLASGLSPRGLAIDALDNVYVTDDASKSVKMISAGSATVTTVASGFNLPFGIAVDASDNVYIADSVDNLVKEILKETGVTIVLP